MEIEIKVRQEILNGKLKEKKYDLTIDIPYGDGKVIRWSSNAYLYGLDRETIKELIERLDKELKRALEI